MTINELRARAGPYPTDALRECESALVLFGAAFLGVNDAIHFANAGTRAVTVVDLDREKLDAMQPLYPSSWEFVAADAFDFVAAKHEAGTRYDVVTADPWSGLMERCRDLLPAFLALARQAVVLGIERGARFDAIPGWRLRRIERSDVLDWLVLERASGPAEG